MLFFALNLKPIIIILFYCYKLEMNNNNRIRDLLNYGSLQFENVKKSKLLEGGSMWEWNFFVSECTIALF